MIFEEVKASFRCSCGRKVSVWTTKDLRSTEFSCACGKQYRVAPLDDHNSATVLFGTKYYNISVSVFHKASSEDME